MILTGDCVELMATLEANSVDAIVTDPPYGLEFMGKEWDRLGAGPEEVSEGMDKSHPFRDGSRRVRYGASGVTMQDWHTRWATEAFRVAKPGAHLLAFGGTRTYHRLASAIEDAGWEIRDCLVWAYASGFPKSLDVSKAIDKAAGAERVLTRAGSVERGGLGEDWDINSSEDRPRYDHPVTPAAARWQGWGTALKPAWEPIVMARKPLVGTVAANVLRHGTGALNIDATRIGTGDELSLHGRKATDNGWDPRMSGDQEPGQTNGQQLGRWPANVVLTDPVLGAEFSRFFTVAKAARSDREPVLRGQLEEGPASALRQRENSYNGSPPVVRENGHPTVKPVELMRHLVRLVTPPGGTVLDCFLGSGTTAIACELEGFAWIGMEREPEYVAIAEARLNGTQRGFSW